MYSNIPAELRAWRQWVCWRYEQNERGQHVKIPYCPATGKAASVADPTTWTSFDTALSAVNGHYNGIGFVLSPADPYTIIDLDNKPDKPISEDEWKTHVKILDSFNSYTERSVSGRGYHIVLKGRLPEDGRRRGNVEVYSSLRYMAFTGDVVRNAPIYEEQELLNALVAEMPASQSRGSLNESATSNLEDIEVVEIARKAINGEKFDELCRGDWQAMGYQSQSEADLALLSILAFYTRDNEQVRRLFRMSGLGKRDKATKNNRYIDTTLAKIRAKEVPMVDLGTVLATAAEKGQEQPPAEPTALENTPALPVATGTSLTLPPGLVGELATYFYNTAIRPVPEIAVMSAIALFAGVVGRSYNISGTGLNQYLVVIAKTGSGKEGAARGMENLLHAVRPRAPTCDTFIGPAAFASGQALVRVLDSKPCFVSVVGEFGHTMKRLLNPYANSSDLVLKAVLLDLFGKSGWGNVLRSTAYSDSEKNTKSIHAPSVTIFGESAPETFYGNLTLEQIAEGLIPRFHIIEYTGPRPALNPSANCAPDAGLQARFLEMLTIALTTQQNNSVAQVGIDGDALALLTEFDQQCDERINNAANPAVAQLWNRAHLKALKLAALLAVGCDPHRPMVGVEAVKWAVGFTTRATLGILARFEAGDVGEGESKQEVELRRVIDEYFAMSKRQLNAYRIDHTLFEAKLIPYDFLRRRTKMLKSFTGDRRGPTKALQDLLRDLVSAEILLQLGMAEGYERFGKRMALFGRGHSY